MMGIAGSFFQNTKNRTIQLQKLSVHPDDTLAGADASTSDANDSQASSSTPLQNSLHNVLVVNTTVKVLGF